MTVACKCGEPLGDASGPNGELKARRVTWANGRLRVKCPKCHAYHEIQGVSVIPTPKNLLILTSAAQAPAQQVRK